MDVSHLSTWQLEKTPTFPSLEHDIEVEVAVVGGGLAGVSCAYQLARAGVGVALFESRTIGSGATLWTTAFLTQHIDTDLTDLAKMFGEGSAKHIWQSGSKAIDIIEQAIHEEKIECEFSRCPAYVYTNGENDLESLEREHDLAKRLGFKTRLHGKNKLPFTQYGSWELEGQAKFHPQKYIFGLADAIRRHGGLIFERARVVDASGNTPITLSTDGGLTVKARHIIVTTYFPANNPEATHYKKGMYKSYVIEGRLPSGTVAEGLYWDLASPYHYFRIDRQKGSDRMILGGEDHRAELPINPERHFEALKVEIERLFGKTIYEIRRGWTGPILEPTDGLPLIGEYHSGRFLATAFSGNGMTYATVSGLLLRDLIMGKKNPWTKLYDPRRSMKVSRLWRKGLDYTKEFFGAAVKNIFHK